MDKRPVVKTPQAMGSEPFGARAPRIMAVSSGKGGVGKTNSVVNLAVAFSRMGKRCLVLDADLGLGNIDVLLGLAPRYNVSDLLRGERTMEEVVVRGPSGVMILPAASGVYELTDLKAEERLALSSHLEKFSSEIDMLIIDTGAGISTNVLYFNVAAQDIVVVVSPEPTSITDAYALMKVLHKRHGERRFKLLVNTARTRKEGIEVFRKISLAAERFLNLSVEYVGCVLRDDDVVRAVREQKAVLELYPDSKASACFMDIAREISATPPSKEIKGGVQFFWRHILSGA